jgi:hypothetical protein
MTLTRIFLTIVIQAPLLYAQAATPVFTRSYDNGRTGANTGESTFTPALVASKGLQRIKSLKVDDPRIEAQPLYVPKLVMKKDGKEHNVVFVASMGNHVFAFDANAKQGKDLLWKSPQLGPPLNPAKDPGSGPNATVVDLYGINKLWGILSTPVIDLDANQMYIVNWIATSNDRKSHALRLHRIRLDDGTEVNGPGLPITGVFNGADGKPAVDARGKPVELDADQKQRAALLLSPLRGLHKTLFIGITGGETPGDPHGWLVAFDVDTFTETAAIPTTQLGFGGGIWQGAQGPSSDDQGNVYVMTGNGGFNAKKNAQDTNPGTIGDFTVSGKTDFAEAFIRFNYQKAADGEATLTIADWFIPFRDSLRKNVNGYDYQDQDLGSAAPVLPPGTNLLMGAGKDGLLYVLDRGNLGKNIGNPTVPPVYITFNGLGLATSGPSTDYALGGGPLQPGGAPTKTHHLHASPAFWNGPNGPRLFDWGENESLRAWSLDTTPKVPVFLAKGAEISSSQLAFSPTGNGGMTGGMISVSSAGTNNGIVWTLAPVDGNANTNVVAGIARAYDATALDATANSDGTPKLKLLWDSTRSGVTFDFSKFCPPMVADGKLYIATYDGRVDVYALKP